jgi:tRNA pseudouridine38-40 synthase
MFGDAAGRSGGRRIAFLVEYDGTGYHGSQFQLNGPSIQSELEAAINNLTAETVRVALAGRTDAGVHALGQVAAVTLCSAASPAELVRGINHFLPERIVIRAASVVPAAFDPRRDAVRRQYSYRIANQSVRPAIGRQYAWHVARPLDLDAMRVAASTLRGKHDFAAFTGAFEGETVRTLERCEVNGSSGSEITVEVEARAFLPHQVRRMVGPLVEVGLGRLATAELAKLLEGARPSTAGPAVPAAGLFLVRVEYEVDPFGPSQGNESTR